MTVHKRYDRCDLYQIGEVSKIGGISQRTLRHYDELGLMEPDVVGDNGYRYYSRQTMLKIPVIRYLKMMGFSLDEIASMQKHSDLLEAKRLFSQHLATCDEEARALAERRRAIVDWTNLVDEANVVLRVRPTAVSVKYQPAQELLCLPSHFTGSFAESIVSLDFAAYVSGLDNAITGPVIMEFDSIDDAVLASSEGRECDVKLLQRPIRPIEPENAWTTPGRMYLCTYHVGAFEEMGSAYRRLLKFAGENGYKPMGIAIERFVSDYWTTNNPELFVTEILLPTETE
jgi:DNA-binding transcriptional MerR regulator